VGGFYGSVQVKAGEVIRKSLKYGGDIRVGFFLPLENSEVCFLKLLYGRLEHGGDSENCGRAGCCG
jgi:hypothetical protein